MPFNYLDDDINFNTVYEIFPLWVINIVAFSWLGYIIWYSGKYRQILDDLKSPTFYGTLIICIFVLFFAKDNNYIRSQRSNRNAVLAGLSAYFGHIDIWFAAFIIGGMLTYYSFNDDERQQLEINWGMDPSKPVSEKKLKG